MEKKGVRLTKNTRFAIALLAAAALAALYFFLVDRPVREGIREADTERGRIESRLNLLQARAENVSGVSDEVDSLTASGHVSWMPSYNSEEAELETLHTLLDSRTTDYQLSFSDVTRTDNQIRRAYTLSFTTDSYETAKTILYRLTHGQYRCLISSVSLSGVTTAESRVHVSLSAMFYETMVGGQPDMGLAESDRGQAVDPMEAGLPFGGLMPSGLAENLDKTKEFISGGPSYSMDDIMAQASE